MNVHPNGAVNLELEQEWKGIKATSSLPTLPLEPTLRPFTSTLLNGLYWGRTQAHSRERDEHM